MFGDLSNLSRSESANLSRSSNVNERLKVTIDLYALLKRNAKARFVYLGGPSQGLGDIGKDQLTSQLLINLKWEKFFNSLSRYGKALVLFQLFILYI